MLSPKSIVKEKMYPHDAFSQWLGIEIVDVGKGSCVTKMKIRPEMTNGFGIAHGGILYSLADSTLAFASNTFGTHTYSFETSISHFHKSEEGDQLTASAILQKRGYKISVFTVEVKNQDAVVALFKGTVYHDKKEWV
jgi:acyl-CoA thioesterase